MLEARIEKGFAERSGSAAFDLSVELAVGDGVTALFGPSGAGKTLTLAAIAGFVRPAGGRISLNGRVLFDSESGVDEPARNRRCGYLFQNDTLFPHMSVRENLEFAGHGLDSAELHRRVEEAIERFRLGRFAARRPEQISGGERRRSAIARTLIRRPELLLMDEPAQGLDVGLRRELYCTIEQVRREYRVPTIVVTHNLDEAFSLADHMLLYSGGRIIQHGSPREIYNRPGSAEAARLLGIDAVFDGEAKGVDEAAGLTRLQTSEFAIEAAFVAVNPGERVSFCIRAEGVVAVPRNGSIPERHAAVRLRRARQEAEQVRLDFVENLSAVVTRETWAEAQGAEDWTVEIPVEAVWVFPDGRGGR